MESNSIAGRPSELGSSGGAQDRVQMALGQFQHLAQGLPTAQPADTVTTVTAESPFAQSVMLTTESTRKRAASAEVSCTHDQLAKRLRASMGAPAPRPSSVGNAEPPVSCLHCKSTYHTWSGCDSFCLYCLERHPRRRCPKIGLDAYLPGGFTIISSATTDHAAEPDACLLSSPVKSESPAEMPIVPTEGISLERQVMIACTVPAQPQVHEAEGPKQTASNLIPLGKPNRMLSATIKADPATVQHAGAAAVYTRGEVTTSQFSRPPPTVPAPVQQGGPPIPSFSRENYALHCPIGQGSFYTSGIPMPLFGVGNLQQPAQRPVTPKVDAHDKAAWMALSTYIRTFVRSCQDPTKSDNNGSDGEAVERKLKQALGSLKSTVVRGKRALPKAEGKAKGRKR